MTIRFCIAARRPGPNGHLKTGAVKRGFYESPWGKHPRCQILTIAELLAGARIDAPPIGRYAADATLKAAPKAKQKGSENAGLFGGDRCHESEGRSDDRRARRCTGAPGAHGVGRQSGRQRGGDHVGRQGPVGTRGAGGDLPGARGERGGGGGGEAGQDAVSLPLGKAAAIPSGAAGDLLGGGLILRTPNPMMVLSAER